MWSLNGKVWSSEFERKENALSPKFRKVAVY